MYWEEKERKIEAEVHGHCNYGLEGDVSIEGGSKTGLCGGNWSQTLTPHRSGKICVDEDFR